MMTKVPFDSEIGGYNRVQVDSYVKLLTEAYNEAFTEYEKACGKYNQLLEKMYHGEETKLHRRGIEKAMEKTLDDYYEEAMRLDSRVDALKL